MNEAMITFFDMCKEVAPYAIFWALGIRAFRFILGAITGKDVDI